MYNSVVFSAFTVLCNHNHNLIPEYFYHQETGWKQDHSWLAETTNLSVMLTNCTTTMLLSFKVMPYLTVPGFTLVRRATLV